MKDKTKIFYKYRSLKDFRFFIDILLNNRLFAAKYNTLNDIREGIYQHDGSLKRATIEKIKEIKEDVRICSATKDKNNQLMWAHYADSHTGVVIGFKINDDDTRIAPVQYNGIKKKVTDEQIEDFDSYTDEILLHKEKDWKYEKEIRILKDVSPDSNLAFINIEIKEIIFGRRMKEDDSIFLTQLINRINPKIKISNLNLQGQN